MRTIYLLILFGLALYSCDKEEPTKTEDTYLSLTVQPTFGTENLFLDSVYTTVEGYDFKILDFKFYMTDVKNNSNQFAEANGLQVAALMYAALILFLLTMIVNILAEFIVARVQRL